MRVTIIKDDNSVIVDGVRRTVDCTDLPADFHALQWYGTEGEVEYALVGKSKKPNEIISSLAPYQKYVDAWQVADTAAKAAAAARIADAAAKAAAAAKLAEGATNVAGPES